MASVVVKTTHRCNAACVYCLAAEDVRSRGPSMTAAVLERLFQRIDEFLRARPRERLTLLWHGGEPLMMGPAFYEEALACQERCCPVTRSRIQHRMQSNLTLFSPKFAEPLRRLGIFGIGTSYEPLPDIRGLGKTRDGEAYRERFRAGVAALEAEGFGWGLIYVVTRPALAEPEAIYRDLTLLKPDGNINVHPVDICSSGSAEAARRLAVSPRELADFLGRLFALWWPERERRPHMEPFRSLIAALTEEKPRLYCLDAGTCAATHFGIEPDGTISHCGRASDRGVLRYGSLFERSFAEVLDDAERSAIAGRAGALAEGECRGCRFWPLCHGGCPLDAHDGSGSFLAKTPWCETKRILFSETLEPALNIRYGAPHVDPHQAR